VLLVGVGPMARTAVDAADILAAAGVSCTVVDPRWVLPVPSALVKLAGEHEHVVCIEDGLVEGGVGALMAQRCVEGGLLTPVHSIGVPLAFLAHATRPQLLAELRLQAADVAQEVLTQLARRER
jgi:1-deoxy-D-xylulose-5-phosphate synthase